MVYGRFLLVISLDAQHHYLLEKCKSKVQQATALRRSEWLSSKALPTINAGEGGEKREPSYIAGRNISGYSHYGDSLRN